MSESSLPLNPSQPNQGVSHSANADAIERQSLYEREDAIQYLLADQSSEEITNASADVAPLMEAAETVVSLEALTGESAPQPEDLVVLIQALNQCNSNLLARVSELEVELAKSQADLKIQAESPNADATSLRTELNQVKLKVMKLRQQMQAAYQTNQSQRSQIQELQSQLTETEQQHSALTEAHVQLQEQFQTQSQRLVEAENTCRDLCLRLHRQQQYTLQFKAALKAQSSMAASVQPSDQPLNSSATVYQRADIVEIASKVREIRPWSTQDSSKTSEPSYPSTTTAESEATEVLRAAESPVMDEASLPSEVYADESAMEAQPASDEPISNVISLDLPAFPSVEQLAAQEERSVESVDTVNSQDSIEPESQQASRPLSPISFDMKHDLPKWAKFSHSPFPDDPVAGQADTAEPALSEQMPEANSASVEPWVASSLDDAAGAIAPNEASITESAPVNAVDPGRESPTPEIDIDPALLEQLDAAVRPLLDSVVDAIRGEVHPPSGSLESSEHAHSSTSETESVRDDFPQSDLSLAASILGQAEEDLWRDLAQLVDISTDDIVQASLSGDFDAFKAIDFDSLRRSLKGEQSEPVEKGDATASFENRAVSPPESIQTAQTENPSLNHPPSKPSSPFSALDLPFPQLASIDDAPEQGEAASGGSPVVEELPPSAVVYPERSPRKLKSISAVDLPTFPRMSSGQPAQA